MTFTKNQSVTVEITDMGNDGEGIGKVEGFPLFVKDAVIGDTVDAKIVKVKKNYAYARLEKVVTPSPFRVEPKCLFYRQCGGCQLQALAYEEQLRFKENKVRNNLIRIGGFSEAELSSCTEPIIKMEDPFYYRNKAQYPIGKNKDGKVIAGFYAGRTHSIVPNTDCCLGRRENKQILETILAYMEEFAVPPYEEETGAGLVRHVLIRTGFASGEIMVCLVVNCARTLPHQEELVRRLAAIKSITSVSLNFNSERTNAIMGKETRTIWGRDSICDSIRIRDMKNEDMNFTGEKLDFAISPLSFYQVNPVQTEKLYSLALSYAGLTGSEVVWDLYCGIGTISLFMATRAKQVYGVEIVPQAVEDARENARRNGIDNAYFYEGKAEEILPRFYAGTLHPDVIVVDPPRKGCDEVCLSTMLKMQPERIVYVSCDSATLARDLRILCAGGYQLKKLRPVDQFAHTGHVETVVLLSQQKPDDYVEVDLELDELDITCAESKATYAS